MPDITTFLPPPYSLSTLCFHFSPPRDGRYERTYYTLRSHQYQLQQQRPIVGPFWAREFEAAHRAIDDDPLSLRATPPPQ